MPLYEYYCADCQDKFETIRPMGAADNPIQCKNCESMRTSRMLSLFAAHTKADSRSPGGFAGGGSFGGGCCGGGSCGCRH